MSSRTRRPSSCMVIDVDQFKGYNDASWARCRRCGAQAGLRAPSGRAAAQDIVARTGGDEFLVICPDTGL